MLDAAMLGLVRTVDRELRRHERKGPSAVEVRAAMKQRGLKHCFYPGYGYRWCRGRRVQDDREVEQIQRIVAMHEQGQPLYRIAVTFLLERVRTRAGKEWSYDRVWRAYGAALRGEVPGVSVGESVRRLGAVPQTAEGCGQG